MKNSQLAAVLGDHLVSLNLIDSSKLDFAIEKLEAKLNAHLGENNGTVVFSEQVVREEKCETNNGKVALAPFKLKNKRIVEGSLSGVVYRKTIAIQTFTVSNEGKFTFTRIGQASDFEVMSGKVDLADGVVTLSWNGPPGYNHIAVNYKYKSEVPDSATVPFEVPTN